MRAICDPGHTKSVIYLPKLVQIYIDTMGRSMLKTSPMSRFRRLALARLAVLFFIVNLLSQPIFIHPAQGAEQTAPFKPPWTEERVKPPETENQEPLAWCDNTRERKRPDGTVESYNDFRVTYANGTEVRYEYGKMRKRWIVIVRGPQGRTRTTYDLTDEKKPTRTVEEPGKPPVTTEWKEAVEALKKKGAFLFDPFGSRLVSASYPVSPRRAEAVPEPERILLAATAPREQSIPAPKTPERPTINIKPVTYGGPLDPPPVIHLDSGPATTPEEFARTLIDKPEHDMAKPPAVPLRKLDPWEIEARDRLEKFATPGGLAVPRYGLPVPRWGSGLDSQGPVTVQPGTTGTPVPQTPGATINIGSGWASTLVPARVLLNCSGEDEADGTQARAPTSAPAPTKEVTAPTTTGAATTPGTTERPTQPPGSPKPVEKIETTTRTNPDDPSAEAPVFLGTVTWDGATYFTAQSPDGRRYIGVRAEEVSVPVDNREQTNVGILPGQDAKEAAKALGGTILATGPQGAIISTVGDPKTIEKKAQEIGLKTNFVEKNFCTIMTPLTPFRGHDHKAHELSGRGVHEHDAPDPGPDWGITPPEIVIRLE